MKTKLLLKMSAISAILTPAISVSCAENDPILSVAQINENTSFKDALSDLKQTYLLFIPSSYQISSDANQNEKTNFEDVKKQHVSLVEGLYKKTSSIYQELNDQNFYQLNSGLLKAAQDFIIQNYNLIDEIEKILFVNKSVSRKNYSKNIALVSKNFINTWFLWWKLQIDLVRKQTFPLIDKALETNLLSQAQKDELSKSKNFLDQAIQEYQNAKTRFLEINNIQSVKEHSNDEKYKAFINNAVNKLNDYFNKFSELVAKTLVQQAPIVQKTSFALPRFTQSEFFNPLTNYKESIKDYELLNPNAESLNVYFKALLRIANNKLISNQQQDEIKQSFNNYFVKKVIKITQESIKDKKLEELEALETIFKDLKLPEDIVPEMATLIKNEVEKLIQTIKDGIEQVKKALKDKKEENKQPEPPLLSSRKSVFSDYVDQLKSFIKSENKEHFIGDNSYLNDLKPFYSAKIQLSDSVNISDGKKETSIWVYKKENGKYPTNNFTTKELKSYEHKLSDILNSYQGDYLIKMTLSQEYLQKLGRLNNWYYKELDKKFKDENPNAQGILIRALSQYQFIPSVNTKGQLDLKYQPVNKDFKTIDRPLEYFGLDGIDRVWGYFITTAQINPQNEYYDFYISLTKEQYDATFGSAANIDKINSTKKAVVTKVENTPETPEGLQNVDIQYDYDSLGVIKVHIIL
ncbi:hypothetical protein NPA11_01380 [Mycoplasma sp. 1578d]|uniref:hypothetical protein n=1 Tax=Mycoplasma sp. 1578d TaxID=2967299 RepID=UPI00211BAB0F|nr:hypothetical protein [Mycoplasma sp. 1578d]UUM20060.1 hypothetical protein NPA11_01380 [Mycoplasma sp. 1578d]